MKTIGKEKKGPQLILGLSIWGEKAKREVEGRRGGDDHRVDVATSGDAAAQSGRCSRAALGCEGQRATVATVVRDHACRRRKKGRSLAAANGGRGFARRWPGDGVRPWQDGRGCAAVLQWWWWLCSDEGLHGMRRR
ncbi:putative histone-lysine N-methyltransferase SETDB2 isoform [Sesbania bispinosa]|nr:putative histone-lysine N-methyltransferase SETDB2 isoform [Sesbania bispinosa]